MDELSDLGVDSGAPILVTGAAGFIGGHVVNALAERGFRDLRCLVRRTSLPLPAGSPLYRCVESGVARVVPGNLMVRADCAEAARDVAVVYHLAAGRGEKSFPDAYMNTVVTTRNLLDAARSQGSLRRFVAVSSFSVFESRNERVIDEAAAVEAYPEMRGEAYCFAKVHQERLVFDYFKRHAVPVVVVRPGWVYGRGNSALTGRVGIGTFGLFLHLGGSNRIPATYVENCAEAIVLAGLVAGVDGESFNVVDDDSPTSRQILRAYKRVVRRFPSIYLPHAVSYAACALWEAYSEWSNEQLPRVFNRRMWRAYWRPTRYSNAKLKARLGWKQKVSTAEGLKRYFESCSTAGES